MSLARSLASDLGLDGELVGKLLPILEAPTGTTKTGYPYLLRAAWEAFRDGVPHLLGMGLDVLRVAEALLAADAPPGEERENLQRACKVARQVVYTAAITAPPDLWLMRHVLGFFAELGLPDRLLRGRRPPWSRRPADRFRDEIFPFHQLF